MPKVKKQKTYKQIMKELTKSNKTKEEKIKEKKKLLERPSVEFQKIQKI